MNNLGKCVLCPHSVIEGTWYVRTESGMLIHGECVLEFKRQKEAQGARSVRTRDQGRGSNNLSH